MDADAQGPPPGSVPADPRFVADAMLGRLARWLRLIGYDTVYDAQLDDRELARIATREGRILLTRDRALLARRIVRGGLLIASEELGPQLRQVITELGLAVARERLFTRCTACNGEVGQATRDDVRGRVPPFVLRSHDRFLICRGCDRIFWPGTHQALALAELERLTGQPDLADGGRSGRVDEPGSAP